MKLKNFKSYSSHYSKDPKNFEKKIALASTGGESPLFDNYSTFEDTLSISKSVPVIIWGNFKFSNMNENFCSVVYNQKNIPSKGELSSAFQEEDFVPNIVKDRSSIKKMNFPIVGVSGEDEEEFKTYGQFKKSKGSSQSRILQVNKTDLQGYIKSELGVEVTLTETNGGGTIVKFNEILTKALEEKLRNRNNAQKR